MNNLISAKIIADSTNATGQRLTTWELVFPRIILAEFNTHRAFSRNSSSSRAIPFKRMVDMVTNAPFVPLAWQKNHSGMQGAEYHTEDIAERLAPNTWLRARDKAIEAAINLNKNCDVTKQLANRLLEPFMYHKVIMTTTDPGLQNFFNLRCPSYSWSNPDITYKSKKDFLNSEDAKMCSNNDSFENWSTVQWLQINRGQAEIHIMDLAEKMWDAYAESTTELLKEGDWHIPYRKEIENLVRDTPVLGLREELGISSVMCARVSYTTIDVEGTEWPTSKYSQKYQDLVTANPIHASPFEHCAMAAPGISSRNFEGFIQYREIIEKETKENRICL